MTDVEFRDGTTEPQHLVFHCPRYSAARAEASRRCRIPFHTRAFLYTDIPHKELTSLIRDTRIGTRHERQEKEAELAGAALLEDNMEEESEDEGGEDEDAIDLDENDDIGLAWLEANIDKIVGRRPVN